MAVARLLKCQPTYISQVLNSSAHFSLEQAEKIARFLELSEDDREYFFLLIQEERAGTEELKEFFRGKINTLLKKRELLTHRLGKEKSLKREKQSIYYSSWIYAAIHIALTVPSLRTPEALAFYFRLPLSRVRQTLERLVSMGIAIKENKSGQIHFRVSQDKVRIGRDSHNILKHHANWRNQATDSLDRENSKDLHYSSVISVSLRDRFRMREMILESLKTQLQISDSSEPEELVAYCIDFFGLQK